MLSLGKLFVLALLVAGVVLAYRWRQRFDQLWAARRTRRRSAAAAPSRLVTEDLIKCPVCAVFVPARGAQRCDAAGCPFGR